MILLDTSGLLSALDASQRYHAECVATLSKASPPLLLSPFVLAELDYLLSRHVGGVAQTALLDEVARDAYQLEPFDANANTLSGLDVPSQSDGSSSGSHSTLIFPVATTWGQRSLSALTNAAVSAGEVPTGLTEQAQSFRRVGQPQYVGYGQGSLSTIAGGVFGGATTLNHSVKTYSGSVLEIVGTPGMRFAPSRRLALSACRICLQLL